MFTKRQEQEGFVVWIEGNCQLLYTWNSFYVSHSQPHPILTFKIKAWATTDIFGQLLFFRWGMIEMGKILYMRF